MVIPEVKYPDEEMKEARWGVVADEEVEGGRMEEVETWEWVEHTEPQTH